VFRPGFWLCALSSHNPKTKAASVRRRTLTGDPASLVSWHWLPRRPGLGTDQRAGPLASAELEVEPTEPKPPHNSPQAFKVALRMSRFFGFIGTRGSRYSSSIKPSMAMAALIGIGLVSMNKSLNRG
jgi:hypothetical protein